MASAPSIELKRHSRQLSEKETNGVVDAVADLIVNFLKTRSRHVAPNGVTHSDSEKAGRGVPHAIGNER